MDNARSMMVVEYCKAFMKSITVTFEVFRIFSHFSSVIITDIEWISCISVRSLEKSLVNVFIMLGEALLESDVPFDFLGNSWK